MINKLATNKYILSYFNLPPRFDMLKCRLAGAAKSEVSRLVYATVAIVALYLGLPAMRQP